MHGGGVKVHDICKIFVVPSFLASSELCRLQDGYIAESLCITISYSNVPPHFCLIYFDYVVDFIILFKAWFAYISPHSPCAAHRVIDATCQGIL